MRLPAFLVLLASACGAGVRPTSDAPDAARPSEATDAARPVSDAADADAGAAPDAMPAAPPSDAGVSLSPPRPQELTAWLTGDDADAEVTPGGPALILMGGGTDVDAAFTWWAPRVNGGDVVVLRTSGEDGYNQYLYDFGADSVETLLVDTRALADSDYVAWRVAHAEGVFIAGGDQATYIEAWKGSRLEEAMAATWARGAVLGGTSAGCAVLGEIIFAALAGSVYSDEALADPYNEYMTLERDFLDLEPLVALVTDTHFSARDRMGRLVAFMARAATDGWAARPLGLGVDEATALLVGPDGVGEVVGSGSVYLVVPAGPPELCAPGTPLEWNGLTVHELAPGDTVTLPAGTTAVPGTTISASDGKLH